MRLFLAALTVGFALSAVGPALACEMMSEVAKLPATPAPSAQTAQTQVPASPVPASEANGG